MGRTGGDAGFCICRDFQEASAQLLEELDGVSDVAGEKNKGHGSKDSFCMHLVGDAVVMSGDGLLWVFHDKELKGGAKKTRPFKNNFFQLKIA